MKCKVKLNTINDAGLFVAKCGEYKDVDIHAKIFVRITKEIDGEMKS